MSYFTAKMHEVRFRLGLLPRPRWEFTALPRPLGAYFQGKGGEEGRGGRAKKRGREGRRREGENGRENHTGTFFIHFEP